MRRGGVRPVTLFLAASVVLVTTTTGCESTQDKSAKIAAELGPVKQEEGLKITKRSTDVKVVGTTLLTDNSGTAVVVEVHNESDKDLIEVPLAIDVLDAKGNSVYRNDIPGIDPALAAVPFIAAGGTVDWVDDQVLATGKPAQVKAVVGASDKTFSGPQPKITVSPPKLEGDPYTGVSAAGEVKNESGEDLQRILLYGVAKKGNQIVAAGRGAIEHFKAGGKPLAYHIYFIGDPHGAELTVTEFPSLPGQEQP